MMTAADIDAGAEAEPGPGPGPGALFAAAIPPVSLAEVEALAADVYGMAASASALTSERDQNFLLRDATGMAYVLRVTNPAEELAATLFQSNVQLHLLRADAGLPVPRLIATRSGAPTGWFLRGAEAPRAVRLIEFMPGVALAKVPRSAAQRRNLGTVLARFDLAMRDFTAPLPAHALLWDMQLAGRLRGLLDAIETPQRRRLASAFMDGFERHVAPHLSTLRRQVIHNDLNPSNVFVDEHDHDRISAILDFGDMVHAPLVIDLAVACSYQLADTDDPLSSALDCVRAYHAVCPLQPAEIDLLFDLIATRLLMTVAITAWRARRYPENRDYILRNAPVSWAGLERFAALTRETGRRILRDACPPTQEQPS